MHHTLHNNAAPSTLSTVPAPHHASKTLPRPRQNPHNPRGPYVISWALFPPATHIVLRKTRLCQRPPPRLARRRQPRLLTLFALQTVPTVSLARPRPPCYTRPACLLYGLPASVTVLLSKRCKTRSRHTTM
ncbi:hypothetical protein BU23DRAFT_569631 [Bimuria novae-zelandiae CBS 107.79]|uniref:Uncharacterized protein n=1 Tax=Bimuria novae-zelandiae CBS 107.79 TaxID=1447943 RepID=A0A6A5V3X3_9PLEO|nr:hypothetical protein BU23DRAFT_569631 [Bimuria novae-zelandiae CBS 107.79]